MKILIVLLFLFPLAAAAHPGIGIVIDSKGNIYYTDLEQVWKITNGTKTIAVPHVHTHQLYLDKNDNLYGEHLRYEGEAINKFNHYMWMLRPNGSLDTLVGLRQAFVRNDYSLARDIEGNEYYIKMNDSAHIFMKPPGGGESVFARGNFKDVKFLHPQKDGSILYVVLNTIYRASGDSITIVANDIARNNPSAFTWDNVTIWGVWEDDDRNVYAALLSDQVIKKISPDGTVTDYYKSKGDWMPTHGVFDNRHQLWVLECSKNNDIRVVRAGTEDKIIKQGNLNSTLLVIAGAGALGILGYLISRRKINKV